MKLEIELTDEEARILYGAAERGQSLTDFESVEIPDYISENIDAVCPKCEHEFVMRDFKIELDIDRPEDPPIDLIEQRMWERIRRAISEAKSTHSQLATA